MLLEAYCLEPRFECWEDLHRLGASRAKPAAEMSGYYGTLLTGGGVLLLLLCACGCGTLASRQGVCESGDAPKQGKYKRDHVV